MRMNSIKKSGSSQWVEWEPQKVQQGPNLMEFSTGASLPQDTHFWADDVLWAGIQGFWQHWQLIALEGLPSSSSICYWLCWFSALLCNAASVFPIWLHCLCLFLSSLVSCLHGQKASRVFMFQYAHSVTSVFTCFVLFWHRSIEAYSFCYYCHLTCKLHEQLPIPSFI